MRHKSFALRGAAVAAILSVGGMTTANAALIGTYEGNDCAGVFGKSFTECVAPAMPGTDLKTPSPIIIKFNFNEDGTVGEVEINPLFPSIDGGEFSWVFGEDGTGTGTWTYTPGAGDPAITSFVAKGGPEFNFFSTGGATVDVPTSRPTTRAASPPVCRTCRSTTRTATSSCRSLLRWPCSGSACSALPWRGVARIADPVRLKVRIATPRPAGRRRFGPRRGEPLRERTRHPRAAARRSGADRRPDASAPVRDTAWESSTDT
jgi:hypothetical protein